MPFSVFTLYPKITQMCLQWSSFSDTLTAKECLREYTAYTGFSFFSLHPFHSFPMAPLPILWTWNPHIPTFWKAPILSYTLVERICTVVIFWGPVHSGRAFILLFLFYRGLFSPRLFSKAKPEIHLEFPLQQNVMCSVMCGLAPRNSLPSHL